VGLNTCEKFYLNLFTQSNISKDFDIEEESDSKSKSKETESIMDDYVVGEVSSFENCQSLNFTNNLNNNSSNFLANTLLQGTYKINTPPPQA
jgi:hypothetical protein